MERQGYVILYEGASSEDIAFPTRLEPRVQWHRNSYMKPFIIRYIGGPSERRGLRDKPADLSLNEAIEQFNQDGQHLTFLVIPGSDSESQCSQDHEFIEKIKNLAEKTTHIIAIGSGVNILARTSLLDGQPASGGSSILAELTQEFPRVLWSDQDICQDNKWRIWTAKSEPSVIKDLALLVNQQLRSNAATIRILPARANQVETPNSIIQPQWNAQDTAKRIREARPPRAVVSEVCQYMLFLELQGQIHQAASLFSAFHTAVQGKIAALDTYYAHNSCFECLEFFWEESGERPVVEGWPLPTPTPEIMAKYLHWSSRDLQGEEEKEYSLETYAALIKYTGNTKNIEDAATLCAEFGREEDAKEYINLLLAKVPAYALRLPRHRPLTKILLSGYVAKLFGRTEKDADEDVNLISQAIQDWVITDTERRKTKAQQQALLATKTYEELLELLEPHRYRDSDDEPLRPPATDESINATEQRLGIPLPDDLKAFYRLHNGMVNVFELGQCGDMPEVHKVEELKWEPAEDLGLNELIYFDKLHLDPLNRNKDIPVGRVLMLTADGEESLFYMEPVDGEDISSWHNRLTYWVHWNPEYTWQGTFRGYIERFARYALNKTRVHASG
ncbi:hypothetical protein ABKN59_002061 [Abortiporus biennis]